LLKLGLWENIQSIMMTQLSWLNQAR
jgi:hypothetical protein